MSDLGAISGTAPGTLVQLGAAAGEDVSDLLRGRGSFGRNNEMSPALAVVLAAVLLVATEQVNARKLAAFSVTSREELTILQLAIRFRDWTNSSAKGGQVDGVRRPAAGCGWQSAAYERPPH